MGDNRTSIVGGFREKVTMERNMITSDIPEDFLIFPFVIKGKYAPNIAKKIFGLLVEKNNRPREEEIERNPEFPYDGTLSVFSDDSSYMWSDIESEDDTDYTRIDQPQLLKCRQVSKAWRFYVDHLMKIWNEVTPTQHVEAIIDGRVDICQRII